MAILIKLLRSETLNDLEQQINAFFVEEGKDVRMEIDLAGGISFANGEYVAPVRLNAPHKRQFQTAEEKEATLESFSRSAAQEQAGAANTEEGADTGE